MLKKPRNDTVVSRETELVELLKRVLSSPTNHAGVRSSEPDVSRGSDHAMRYTAKRLPDTLLDEIREAVRA